MGTITASLGKVAGEFFDDPFVTILFLASAIVYATTPLAFLILSRANYLQTRRGRTFQPPSFVSIVVGMMLVLAVPAIVCAMVVKSRYYDKDRYEYDPNKSWSVLEQGRGLRNPQEVDQALKVEQERLDEQRRLLANSLKELDKAILDAVNEMGGATPNLASAVRKLTTQLGPAHKWSRIDAPQQLIDLTATPVDLLIAKNQPTIAMAAPGGVAAAPTAPTTGLPKATVDAELATVPAPQKALASLLPLTDIPPGWTVGKMDTKHLETFSADNLYEKIDGRAESFLLFDVRGMAYTFYHPIGDASQEVQVYIFEMGNSLKALGKFRSEKPSGESDDVKTVAVGKEGYDAAGSTLFFLDKYYVQIVSTKDDPKFSEFVLAIARMIEAAVDPALAASRSPQPTGSAPTAPTAAAKKEVDPDELFALLPKEPKHGDPKYATEDVFGYSFLSDVFLADYDDGKDSWQGFLRTFPTADEAKAMLTTYAAAVKDNGATVKTITLEGASGAISADNFGLLDVVFFKGNTFGGVNGSSSPAKAEAFAKAFAQSLPESAPFIASEPAKAPKPATGEGEGDQ